MEISCWPKPKTPCRSSSRNGGCAKNEFPLYWEFTDAFYSDRQAGRHHELMSEDKAAIVFYSLIYLLDCAFAIHSKAMLDEWPGASAAGAAKGSMFGDNFVSPKLVEHHKQVLGRRRRVGCSRQRKWWTSRKGKNGKKLRHLGKLISVFIDLIRRTVVVVVVRQATVTLVLAA